jgi:exonuclease III
MNNDLKPLVTINVNGMLDNKKRDLVFNWLAAKRINLICLQETHCVNNDMDPWKLEWNKHGGGHSNLNCGSNESRGIAMLPSKIYSNDTIGRVKCEIKTETALFLYFQYLRPDQNIFFDSLLNSIGNHNDDSLQHYELFSGDFNCVLDKY